MFFKEKHKWKIQQEEFEKRKRDHEMQILEMEKQEIQRREEEIRIRRDVLDDKQKSHRQIENSIIQQVWGSPHYKILLITIIITFVLNSYLQ